MNLNLNDPINFEEFEEKQDSFRDGQLQYQFLLVENQIKEILIRSCKNSLVEFKSKHRI